jgi:CheY-like chemotaxis protein
MATILVVEDEGVVRGLLMRILSRQGYRVLGAASGAEAVAAATDEGPIDLLLTDLDVSDMSGQELADRLLAGSAGLPVLYLAGYADQLAVPPPRPSPAVGLLAKPFTAETLARRVREMLERPQ